MIYSRFIGKISAFFDRLLDILPIRFDTPPVLIGKLRIISDRLLIILPINRVMFCSLICKSRILSCCQMFAMFTVWNRICVVKWYPQLKTLQLWAVLSCVSENTLKIHIFHTLFTYGQEKHMKKADTTTFARFV